MTTISRSGGTGRRAGFKIRFWQQSGSSILPFGTIIFFVFRALRHPWCKSGVIAAIPFGTSTVSCRSGIETSRLRRVFPNQSGARSAARLESAEQSQTATVIVAGQNFPDRDWTQLALENFSQNLAMIGTDFKVALV